MRIQLLGLPTRLGIPGVASTQGPRRFRELGLVNQLNALGASVSDLGDLFVPEPIVGEEDLSSRWLGQVLEVASRQVAEVATVYRPGDLLLTLGGDHTTALGSVLSLRRLGENFDLLWIDAHGDFNTPETSYTGNPHGMPLAMLCGLTPDLVPGVMEPSQLRLLGIRSLDDKEEALLAEHRVQVLGVSESLSQLESLVAGLAERVFISFDLDSLDPTVSPGVSTDVPGGFTLDEALRIVRAIASQREVVGLDIVELNPGRDRDDLSAQAGLAVAQTVVEEQLRLRTKL